MIKVEAFVDENNIRLQTINGDFGYSVKLTVEEAKTLVRSLQLRLEDLKNRDIDITEKPKDWPKGCP